MAALDVFKAISHQVDSDFLAMDILPILWQFSLGPLLNLPQFQAYMSLIKTTSARVENEQTRKLQELGANSSSATTRNEFMTFGGPSTSNGFDTSNGNGDTDFEALVRGGQQGSSGGTDMLGGDPWANAPASAASSTMLPSRPSNNRTRSNNASPAPTFSWSTPPVSPPPQTNLSAPKPQGRSVTPDNTLNTLNSSFPALSAANPGIGSSSYTQSQQQSRPGMNMGSMMSSNTATTTPSYNNPSQNAGIDWSKAGGSSSNAWGGTSSTTTNTNTSSMSSFPAIAPPPAQSQSPYSSFNIAPPPMKPAPGTFSIAPPPGMGSRTASSGSGMGMGMGMNNSMASLRAQTQSQQQQKTQQMNWGSGGDSLI